MGIQGLLPQLKPIQNPVTLRRYEGQILGIDGYAWLHRAAYSCAHELVLGQPTEKYLQFFIKKISMLRNFKIEPYIVFDGGSISVKKDTELKRRQKREGNKAIAEKLWKSGEKAHAMEYFQKCVDITPEMAKCIIDYCKVNRIRYVVAPFEADSQMVYLEKKGFIDGIISEDSDLLIFGCRKLITKLNDYGECIEICSDDFQHLKDNKFPLSALNLDGMRSMVSLSGCDYTDGIPKVGLIRAIKLVQRFTKMEKIINHIKMEGKLAVPANFYDEYEKANYSFQFQRVFCPQRREIVTLNEIPDKLLTIPHIAEKISESIGNPVHNTTRERFSGIASSNIDHKLHEKLALGELNPYDFNKPLANREIRLQLSTKSEIVTSNKPSLRTRTIESYFGLKSSQKERRPTRSNTTIGTMSLALLDGLSPAASQVPQDRRYFSTTLNDRNVKSSMQRQEEKTDKLINNRLLTVRAKRSVSSIHETTETKSTKLSSPISIGTTATTSKFFVKSQEVKKCSTLVPNIMQRFRQPSSVQESDVETEVPESMLPTQVSTRSSTSLPTYEDDSPSDISELSENEHVPNNDPTSHQIPDSTVGKVDEETHHPRKLLGTKNILEAFRYTNTKADTNVDKDDRRIPFKEHNTNKRDKDGLSQFTEKNKMPNKDVINNILNRPKTRNSIVCTAKRSSSIDSNGNNTGTRDYITSNKETGEFNSIRQIGSRGIELKVSRSSSQVFDDEYQEEILPRNKSIKVAPTRRIVQTSQRSISSLSCFSYKGP